MNDTLKYIIFIVWAACFMVPCSTERAYAIEPDSKSSWIMVWQDEFEGEAIDSSKWRVEDAKLFKNNERQYYSPEDVYLKDGYLVIRSRKNKMGGRDYTSGLVETKGLFSQTYGYFEVRAKLPKGQGIWPAHWMMNTVGTWPPEIDIMELLGHRPHKVHMTNHFGVHPNNSREGSFFVGSDFSEDFHTFAVEWGPSVLRWYIDDVQRFSTKKHIPHVPFYLILNTAVGGNWPGDPDETTVFPQFHYIDYVRVYKKNRPGMAFIVAFAEGGKVITTPDQDHYPLGSSVELKAQADIGYVFDHWGGDVQGSDNPLRFELDRNLKLSALFKKDPEGPQLLSRGKKGIASSTESDQLVAAYAVDGKPGTRWSSKFSDPQWLYVDLEKMCHIKAVKLHWETAHAKRYKIQVSKNTLDWETVKTIDDFDGPVQNIWLENITGRYVRLMGLERATEWGYSIWEIEIYGEEFSE